MAYKTEQYILLNAKRSHTEHFIKMQKSNRQKMKGTERTAEKKIWMWHIPQLCKLLDNLLSAIPTAEPFRSWE